MSQSDTAPDKGPDWNARMREARNRAHKALIAYTNAGEMEARSAMQEETFQQKGDADSLCAAVQRVLDSVGALEECRAVFGENKAEDPAHGHRYPGLNPACDMTFVMENGDGGDMVMVSVTWSHTRHVQVLAFLPLSADECAMRPFERPARRPMAASVTFENDDSEVLAQRVGETVVELAAWRAEENRVGCPPGTLTRSGLRGLPLDK